MAYSSWITSGRAHVNSFGSSSQFWLLSQYRYERSGNTVNYQIKLTLQYRNTAASGSGTYNYPLGVSLSWNGGSQSSWQQVSSGGSWSSSGGSYTDVGSYTWTKWITNTTGSGSVGFGSYANNTSYWGFDSPGPHSYSAAIPPLDTYTVSYNAQGGTGAPSSQTANIGTSITIPLQKPEKSTSASNPFVVTFNGNNGSVDETSLTSYSRTGSIFSTWNTKADGTGTNYAPGATFSASSNTTLYAIYTSTTARDSVILPSGSKNGFKLLGYGTTSTATTYVSNPYTPAGNITLYAIWGENTQTGWTVIRPVVRIKL